MKISLKNIKLFFCFLALFIFLVFVFNTKAEEKNKFSDNNSKLFNYVHLFADAMTLINSEYIEVMDVKKLVYGAINGMINTLDGYSQFMEPENFKEITEETKGEFAGVGISIGIKNRILTVISCMEDTPAFNSGIKPGDKIVKIDTKLTQNISLDDAVKLLRGENGTEVKIKIVRNGEKELLEFNIIRSIIKIKSIKNPHIVDENIGYVKITEFQKNTSRDLEAILKGFIKKDVIGFIIDLRDNPGGLLESAVETVDKLLDKGKLIVYTESRDAKEKIDFVSKENTKFSNIPIIVLVNKGSASGAEIFAGAIKDNKRGILVGENTFGKGSVQTVIPLEDKSALRLTTAEYFTPLGYSLRNKGIKPDIYVRDIDNKDKEDDCKNIEEDIFETMKNKDKEQIKKYDIQTTTAINILKSLLIFNDFKK